MEDNDDDYFSDDLDSLPPGTLYELEQNAFQATQAPVTQREQKQVAGNDYFHSQPAPSVPQAAAALNAPPRLPTGLTNDYDTLGVGELEAEVHDNGSHHAFIPQNGWPVNGGMGDAMEVDDYTQTNYAQGNVYEWHARMEQVLLYMSKLCIIYANSTLQIEQENEQMRRELAEAKMLAETKSGEIAIIRSKQARMAEEYDRQLSSLRNSMADEANKHKEEVETAMSEGKMLATENIFLQQDLAEEAHQLRNFKSKQRDDPKDAPTTPRKSRALPFRDGFDDDEIAVVSPSKSAARAKRSTPTVPGKRKRRASQDSPAPLQLSPARELLGDNASPDISGPSFDEERPSYGTSRNDHQILKRLMNHRMILGQETDIEALANIAFPSDPERPISTLLLDELAKLDMGSYVVEYMSIVGPLWHRAIAERFYQPVPRFQAIARYILMMDDIPLTELVTSIVGVLQDSVEVNAVPRFRFSPAAREKQRVLRQTPRSDLQPQVDSTDALRLLYHISSELLHVKSALDSFWSHIRHTFILVMLHGSQPLKDIVLILHLLSTSIRPDSFGPIMSSEQDQADVQRWIVDRLTFMLSESAQPDEGVEPYTPLDICAMRLEVLLLLESLAFNPGASSHDHGSIIIAAHPNALARLFRSMHDELDALYSSPPEQDLRVALVNGLMRLIFGVMRRHGPAINMQEKLACVPGSKQKHLVVLTRLAFCDGSVLEAGIDDETVDMAHELLEEWTNPQEAEALAEVFPSSRRD